MDAGDLDTSFTVNTAAKAAYSKMLEAASYSLHAAAKRFLHHPER